MTIGFRVQYFSAYYTTCCTSVITFHGYIITGPLLLVMITKGHDLKAKMHPHPEGVVIITHKSASYYCNLSLLISSSLHVVQSHQTYDILIPPKTQYRVGGRDC